MVWNFSQRQSLDRCPLIEDFGGDGQRGDEALDHAQPLQMLGIGLSQRIDDRCAGRLPSVKQDLVGGHPRHVIQAQREFGQTGQFCLNVESWLGAANEADASLDFLAIFRRNLDFQIRQVTMTGGRLHARQRPALLEQMHQFLPGRLGRGIDGRPRRIGRQILGKKIHGRFQGFGQSRQGRIVPQSVQPDNAILDTQGRSQLFREGPGNDFIFAGIDHEHMPLLGPVAKSRRILQGIGLDEGLLDRRPLASRQAVEGLAQRAGFPGMLHDRQHVAAGEEQNGECDPWLLPCGSAGENSAHRNPHDADLPRIDLWREASTSTVRRTSSTPWARALLQSRGSAARARGPLGVPRSA